MNIRDRVLAVLESESKEVFLLALGHRLGISARFIFSERSSDALQQARACNEMMIAIWLQVWAMKDDEGDGYPDSEFLPILLGKADAGNARSHLRNAIESALLSVGGDDPIP
ncbi:hypothetical protein E0500_004570 [Streptomyces sp. KM273126]|uniref:hypothetical protein n=1 Tax=Streptomyces sp. KM273126 TaxID=2545247 RepID=UPI00103C6D0B|nr:hypothetical protein [Streptomyces sp. KM273126]MBA2806745.1 hypothetical protein [Streptomyces sp. KM273126]